MSPQSEKMPPSTRETGDPCKYTNTGPGGLPKPVAEATLFSEGDRAVLRAAQMLYLHMIRFARVVP